MLKKIQFGLGVVCFALSFIYLLPRLFTPMFGQILLLRGDGWDPGQRLTSTSIQNRPVPTLDITGFN